MEKIRVIKMLSNQIDAPLGSGALVLVGRVIVGGGVMAKPNELERGGRRNRELEREKEEEDKGKGEKTNELK
jgi:hypothetical protein